MFGDGLKKYLFLSLLHNQLEIREESSEDFSDITAFIHEAFLYMHREPSEPQLVISLRENHAHVSKLCVVAIMNGKLVGHIFYTNLKVENNTSKVNLLALAPVSVLPEYQGKGIGSILIRKTIKEAQALGYDAIVLVGHADYYPRFGFEKLSTTGLNLPFEVPEENAMILHLSELGAKNVSGMLQYDQAFMS